MPDPDFPAMAWLSLMSLAIALAFGLAWVARLGRRRLWEAVGVVLLVLLAAFFISGGAVDYRIGCGINCGGVARTDVLMVFLDALLVAAILSLPPRILRFSLQVATATAVSVAFFTLTVVRVVA